MFSIPLRSWATPLVIAASGLMAVTGTLMFFHVQPGLSKVVHEWAGWVFLAGAGAHLALNWRAFTLYLRRPAAQVILVAGGAVLGLSLLPAQSGGGADIRAIMTGLSGAELTELAAISGQTDADLLALLTAKRFAATSPHQTVTELADGDDMSKAVILQTALARPAE